MISNYQKCFLCVAYFVLSLNAFSQTKLITIKCQNFDKEVTVDSDFLNKVILISDYSAKNSILILVQQSFRIVGEKIDNAIVKPILRSNHFVGHAIDLNIEYDGIWYNSTKLRKYNELPEAIINFITFCRINGIRWGGDFIVQDVVHFDDNIEENNPILYNELFLLYQKIYFMK
jgi:hypothetical protein